MICFMESVGESSQKGMENNPIESLIQTSLMLFEKQVINIVI